MMILSWEADGMAYDERLIADIAEKLGLSEAAVRESDENIESKRGNGDWGGQRNKVLEHATSRIESASTTNLLPNDGPIADAVKGLLKHFRGGSEPADVLTAFFDDESDDESDNGSNDGSDDALDDIDASSASTSDLNSEPIQDLNSQTEDNSDSSNESQAGDGPTFSDTFETDATIEQTDEVDPFEELGVVSQTNTFSGSDNNDSSSDALSALLDDTGEVSIASRGDLLSELVGAGEFTEEGERGAEGELGLDEPVDEGVLSETEEQPSPSETESKMATTTAEVVAGPSADEAYTMLLRTVWVDGILDPAEVQLLARKRVELGITFEHHLQLVRAVIG
jgi:hypothetical protein